MQALNEFMVGARCPVAEKSFLIRIHKLNERANNCARSITVQSIHLPIEALAINGVSCVESGDITIPALQNVVQAVIQSLGDSAIPFEPYAPVRLQNLNLLRWVNAARHAAGLERVPSSVIRMKRRIVKPFEPLPHENTAYRAGCVSTETTANGRQESSWHVTI